MFYIRYIHAMRLHRNSKHQTHAEQQLSFSTTTFCFIFLLYVIHDLVVSLHKIDGRIDSLAILLVLVFIPHQLPAHGTSEVLRQSGFLSREIFIFNFVIEWKDIKFNYSCK